MDRFIDWRILAAVLALAALTVFIAIIMSIRRRGAAARARLVNRFKDAGVGARQARLTRSAEELAAGNVPPEPTCACGYNPEGTPHRGGRLHRFHRRTCPAWTQEGAEAFAARWRTERGQFDPAAPPAVRVQVRPAQPGFDFEWQNPAAREDMAHALGVAVDELPQPATREEVLEFVRDFQPGGGSFGGAGATGSYESAPAAPEPAPSPEPAATPAYESPAPTPTESPSYSYDPGPPSGNDTSGGGSFES